MPSANGVYSLPAGYLAVTGATIQASQHNPPLEDIAAALTARLSRDGTAAMSGPIQLAPGVVGTPGAVFSTDLTTGFYKTTSGIGVAVAGVKVAEFLSGGVIGSRYVGEMFMWTGTAAPPLCVLPYGQTLSRTTYAALWTFAQAEIASGNQFFNNGDGSTTFGVGDLRGRVVAGKDNMGGSAAGRLTSTTFSPNATTLGAISSGLAQGETITLTTPNLPPYTPGGTVNTGTVVFNSANVSSANGGGNSITTGGFSSIGALNLNAATFAGFSFTGSPQGGSSVPVGNVQPSLITNFALFAGA